jgi:hypothetical protein
VGVTITCSIPQPNTARIFLFGPPQKLKNTLPIKAPVYLLTIIPRCYHCYNIAIVVVLVAVVVAVAVAVVFVVALFLLLLLLSLSPVPLSVSTYPRVLASPKLRLSH